jgi:hypothetical protein
VRSGSGCACLASNPPHAGKAGRRCQDVSAAGGEAPRSLGGGACCVGGAPEVASGPRMLERPSNWRWASAGKGARGDPEPTAESGEAPKSFGGGACCGGGAPEGALETASSPRLRERPGTGKWASAGKGVKAELSSAWRQKSWGITRQFAAPAVGKRLSRRGLLTFKRRDGRTLKHRAPRQAGWRWRIRAGLAFASRVADADARVLAWRVRAWRAALEWRWWRCGPPRQWSRRRRRR